MEQTVINIVEILKELADRIVLDEYLEEVSRFDYNILTKKDKKAIIKAEEGNIENGLLKSFGISKILKSRLDEAGIENYIVKGYYEGASNSKYYWNRVKIEGIWFNIDLGYSLKYIRCRTMPDSILVLDKRLTFQKEFSNLEIGYNKKINIESPFTIEKEKKILQILEERILNSNQPDKESKKYVIDLKFKMNKRYLRRTYRRYLNLMPYYELEEFINKNDEEFINMPDSSQELIFYEKPYCLKEILEDKEKYSIMYKNRDKVLKFGGYFKTLEDFMLCNNGIRGKLEKLRIDSFGRKIPVIIYIEEEYTWYYYIEEFLNALEKLYLEREKIKKIIDEKEKKEKLDIIIEIYNYMMSNYIIEKGYNKYLDITNYDELLYNENLESSTTQGICRINNNYGICSALSTIFKELLSVFEIKNEIVYGYIVYGKNNFRHQWNIVQIEGEEYIVDILIGLEDIEKTKGKIFNTTKYNYGLLLRKRRNKKLYI